VSEGTREVTAAEMRRWLIDPPDSPEWPLRWADGSPMPAVVVLGEPSAPSSPAEFIARLRGATYDDTIVTAGPEEPWTVDSLLDAIGRHKARPAFTAPEPILMHPSLLRLIRGEPDRRCDDARTVFSDHHRPAPPPKTDRPRGGPVWLVASLPHPQPADRPSSDNPSRPTEPA
jgi:hypothetical protein